MSLSKTVKRGDHRKSLEAMRDKLAESMDKAEPNVVAQIAARLQAVLAELAGMPEPKGTALDDVDARRKERRARADAGMRAKRRRRTERRT